VPITKSNDGREDHVTATQADVVIAISENGDSATFEVAAGEYHFTAPAKTAGKF